MVLVLAMGLMGHTMEINEYSRELCATIDVVFQPLPLSTAAHPSPCSSPIDTAAEGLISTFFFTLLHFACIAELQHALHPQPLT